LFPTITRFIVSVVIGIVVAVFFYSSTTTTTAAIYYYGAVDAIATDVPNVPTTNGYEEEDRDLGPMLDEEDEDESDDEDDDFKDLEPDERKRRILLKSFYQMGLGTLLVLTFSDPMTDVLAAIGGGLGVSPFYVAFILAPIASNASELTASLNFASKKTKKSITTSLDQLLGAGCCNNTFCLGVFLALVYFQGLAWKFTAEVIITLVVEWIMFVYVMMKTTQTVADGLMVLTLYPLSLVLVWTLENVVGLD